MEFWCEEGGNNDVQLEAFTLFNRENSGVNSVYLEK